MIDESLTCSSCGQVIDEFDRAAACERQIVWVPQRRSRQGGTNAVRASISLQQWAHARCVDEIARGHRPQPENPVQWRQGSLF